MKKTIPYLFTILSTAVFGQTPGGGVTDIDGNNYASVIIGDQESIARELLRVSKFVNGDPIPNISAGGAWYQLNTPAFCWYDNDSVSFNSVNGKLYNWYVVNDTRDACPSG